MSPFKTPADTQRIIIFGNSGSGKSTLASEYVAKFGLSYLDLDSLAWLKTSPPSRKPIPESIVEIEKFIKTSHGWVTEGCYSDLLSLLVNRANKVIFLNPGVETCINNCKNRPWEPHKYKSIEEQNRNLNMLLLWVAEYGTRTDEFSLISHQRLYDDFRGEKIEYKSNSRSTL